MASRLACQDLGVLHRDRRGDGKQPTELGGPVVERLLVVRVHVQGTHHATAGDQRKRHRAVHTESCYPCPEPRPSRVATQRPRQNGLPVAGCRDAGTLSDAVLDVIDLPYERRRGRDRIRPILLQHGQTGPVRARDGMDREHRHLTQEVLEQQLARRQSCQRRYAGPEIFFLDEATIVRRHIPLDLAGPGMVRRYICHGHSPSPVHLISS